MKLKLLIATCLLLSTVSAFAGMPICQLEEKTVFTGSKKVITDVSKSEAFTKQGLTKEDCFEAAVIKAEQSDKEFFSIRNLSKKENSKKEVGLQVVKWQFKKPGIFNDAEGVVTKHTLNCRETLNLTETNIRDNQMYHESCLKIEIFSNAKIPFSI